jgi:ribonuclease D
MNSPGNPTPEPACANDAWVATTAAVAELVAKLERNRTTVVAIDTEADSLHRYRESLCLIQFTDGQDHCLVDPLGADDLSALAAFLEKSVVWMHGADYDMTMLKREFGILPRQVPDTQIGARLLGLRQFGLANLVEHYFGETLSKSSQKADWGKRPLTPKMLEYAINDVRFLLPMGEMIVTELKEKSRYEWFLESCDAAREKVLQRDDSREEPWRISGSGKLDGLGLALLREIWQWRDYEASCWDRPSFMVATNRQLLEWCELLLAGKSVKLPGHYRSDRRERFDAALAKARGLERDDWPVKPRGLRRRRDNSFEEKYQKLASRRDKVAAELGIDPSIIASRAVLEGIVDAETTPEQALLRWQREVLDL